MKRWRKTRKVSIHLYDSEIELLKQAEALTGDTRSQIVRAILNKELGASDMPGTFPWATA